MKLNQFYDDIVQYDSLNDLLDRYYDARGERERVKQRANDLVRFVQQQLQKQQNKLSKLIDEYESAKDKETQQLYGELITANIYRIKQGDESVTALNYYTEKKLQFHLTQLNHHQSTHSIITNNIIVLKHVNTNLIIKFN